MPALSPIARPASASSSPPPAFDERDNTPSQVDAGMLPMGIVPLPGWNHTGTSSGGQHATSELRAIDGFRMAAERSQGLATDTSLMGQARQDAVASVYNAMNRQDLLPEQAAQVKEVLTQLGNQLANSKQPLAITSKFCDQLYALATAPALSSSYADALKQTMQVAASLESSQSSGAGAGTQAGQQSPWRSSALSDAAFDATVVTGKIAEARAQWQAAQAAQAKDAPGGNDTTVSGVAAKPAISESHAQPGKDSLNISMGNRGSDAADAATATARAKAEEQQRLAELGRNQQDLRGILDQAQAINDADKNIPNAALQNLITEANDQRTLVQKTTDAVSNGWNTAKRIANESWAHPDEFGIGTLKGVGNLPTDLINLGVTAVKQMMGTPLVVKALDAQALQSYQAGDIAKANQYAAAAQQLSREGYVQDLFEITNDAQRGGALVGSIVMPGALAKGAGALGTVVRGVEGAETLAGARRMQTIAEGVNATGGVAAKGTVQLEKALPPLQRIHAAETLTTGSAKYGTESVSKMSTEDIVKSLKPGSAEPLKVKPDGRIFDGNTRVFILEQRGYDVNTLPRVIIP